MSSARSTLALAANGVEPHRSGALAHVEAPPRVFRDVLRRIDSPNYQDRRLSILAQGWLVVNAGLTTVNAYLTIAHARGLRHCLWVDHVALRRRLAKYGVQ